MTSKNWSRRSVLACVVISLAASSLWAQTPAIALIDGSDAAQWEAWAKDTGWRVITAPPANNPDARIQALAAVVRDAIRTNGVDSARVYLAGRGAASAALFYAIARVPDLWAAAIAIEGSLQPAIDTNRIFTANFTLVPVLWTSSVDSDEALAAKLKEAGLNLEWRPAKNTSPAAILEWLKPHRRDPFPAEIDCETNSPTFASCYWIQ